MQNPSTSEGGLCMEWGRGDKGWVPRLWLHGGTFMATPVAENLVMKRG